MEGSWYVFNVKGRTNVHVVFAADNKEATEKAISMAAGVENISYGPNRISSEEAGRIQDSWRSN